MGFFAFWPELHKHYGKAFPLFIKRDQSCITWLYRDTMRPGMAAVHPDRSKVCQSTTVPLGGSCQIAIPEDEDPWYYRWLWLAKCIQQKGRGKGGSWEVVVQGIRGFRESRIIPFGTRLDI
jgi:hypothetical protein